MTTVTKAPELHQLQTTENVFAQTKTVNLSDFDPDVGLLRPLLSTLVNSKLGGGSSDRCQHAYNINMSTAADDDYESDSDDHGDAPHFDLQSSVNEINLITHHRHDRPIKS